MSDHGIPEHTFFTWRTARHTRTTARNTRIIADEITSARREAEAAQDAALADTRRLIAARSPAGIRRQQEVDAWWEKQKRKPYYQRRQQEIKADSATWFAKQRAARGSG